MATMPETVNSEKHATVPPCTCPDCLFATRAADRRRAEIEAILSRLDELDDGLKQYEVGL